MTPVRPSFAAVVLTGGTAARMPGADKAALEVDGRSLLDRALDAVSAASEVVVVGPRRPTSRPVAWTRECPAGGGPAAGLLAGLARLAGRPDLVAVLAVDMPRVDGRTLARLVDAASADATEPACDGAVLVDPSGRRQPLCAMYRPGVLLARAPADPHGLPVHRLLAGLRLVDVPAVGEEARDVDTWDDLSRLRSDS